MTVGVVSRCRGEQVKYVPLERQHMKVISLVGPSDSGKTMLAERLTRRLTEHGQVGTVKHIDCSPDLDPEGKDTARHRDAGAVQTYGLADGEWFATGEELSLAGALEQLSVSCDYALVEGYTDAQLPSVVLGDESRDETGQKREVIARAQSPNDLDLEAVIEGIEAVEPYETLPSLIARARESPDADKAGAIATFTGRVREKEHDDDEPTEYLEYEKYDRVAEEQMATICAELEAREGVYEVLAHHRTGVVEAGEDSVFVVVLAGHRPEAFRAVEDGINRLKAEVPLFKKEVTVSEEFWAHESRPSS